MATYADLKTRIVAEMNRLDLVDDPETATLMAIHIGDAINEYADMRFWFNQSIQTVATTANVNEITLPTAMRIIDRLAGPYGDLTPVTLDQFPDYGTFAADAVGPPWQYTYLDGGVIRFNTIPAEAYAMTAYGIAEIPAPVNDADSSVWTNEMQGLISAHTRMTLSRDKFKDQVATGLAANAVQMHLAKLRRETDRRLRTRLAAQLTRPNGQPVRRAYLDRL